MGWVWEFIKKIVIVKQNYTMFLKRKWVFLFFLQLIHARNLFEFVIALSIFSGA